MANHKSALKRIRSDESKRSLNKLQHKTARNAIKKLKENPELLKSWENKYKKS